MITPPISLVVSLYLALAPGGAADAGAAAPAPADKRPAPPPSLLSPLTVTAPRHNDDEYILRRTHDGSGDLVYEAAPFTARVARDGTVTFKDKHASAGIHFLPIKPLHQTYGVPTLEQTIRHMGSHDHGPPPPPDGPPPDDEVTNPSTDVSRYRPDVREACRYPQPCFTGASAVLLSVSGTFDVTDELMRLAHQDPYRYAKARFLTATRDLRVHMATRAHRDDLRRSAADLPVTLQRIACDDRLSLHDRRAILESLRSEMDSDTAEGGAAAAEIARFLETFTRPDAGGGDRACPPE
jgi:hypothetical protein